MSEESTATPERPVRDPFRYLMGLARKHGPVAPYRAGTERAFLVDDADLVKRVLADNASNYSKGTFINETFKMVVADGLLTLEGADWRRERPIPVAQGVYDGWTPLEVGGTEA